MLSQTSGLQDPFEGVVSASDVSHECSDLVCWSRNPKNAEVGARPLGLQGSFGSRERACELNWSSPTRSRQPRFVQVKVEGP